MGGANRNEKAMPITNIQPRLLRVESLAALMFPEPKRKAAKISAARTVPRIPACDPKISAITSNTRAKTSGTRFFQECPAAITLAPRAARPQIREPRATSMSGAEQSLPAVIFIPVRLMKWVICIRKPTIARMTKDRVVVGKIESWKPDFFCFCGEQSNAMSGPHAK